MTVVFRQQVINSLGRGGFLCFTTPLVLLGLNLEARFVLITE